METSRIERENMRKRQVEEFDSDSAPDVRVKLTGEACSKIC